MLPGPKAFEFLVEHIVRLNSSSVDSILKYDCFWRCLRNCVLVLLTVVECSVNCLLNWFDILFIRECSYFERNNCIDILCFSIGETLLSAISWSATKFTFFQVCSPFYSLKLTEFTLEKFTYVLLAALTLTTFLLKLELVCGQN